MAKIQKHFPLILILCLGLILRLININQSLWLDEASQAHLSSLSVSQIWQGRGGDFHPPLFYLMAHFWQQFSRLEVWLRLLPVTFGLTNVAVIYLFAKYLKQKNPAISGLLLALAPFHIYYSQEYRMYSLLCLLGTISMYLLHSRKYLWLAVVNTLLLYTHYSGVFLIITQLVYVFLYSRSDLSRLAFSYLVSAVSFLPWLPQFIRQLNSGMNIDEYLPGWRNILSISPLKATPVIFFKLVAGRISFLSRYLYGAYIAFVFAVTFFSALITPHRRRFLFTWAFVPLILLLLTSLVLPQNQPFRVIFILPALILVFAGACTRYPKLILTLLLYIFLVGDIAYFTRPRLQREQWRQALAEISSYSGVIVKSSDKFAPFYWYAPNLPVISAIPGYPAAYPAVLTRLAAAQLPAQVYLFEYLTDLTDPSLQVEAALTTLHYRQTKILNYEGVGFIYQFTRI